MMVCRRMVHQRIRCGAAVSRNVELLCKDLLGSQSWSMNPMWEYFLPKPACGAACAPKRSCRCASEGLTVRVPCPSTLRCLADRRGCRRRTSLPVSVVTSRLSRLLGRESLRGGYPMVDPERFRDVMARHAAGVTVVTTAHPSGYHGVTVTAFCPLSLEPPLVLVCIGREQQSHRLLEEATGWVVNLLAREQEFLAEQFAGRAPLADPRFSRIPHHLGLLGIPRIDGCLAWIECRPWARYDGGDHSIFVGEVVALDLGPADDPLIYFDRQYRELAW